MASTYGCYSKINIFNIFSDIINFPASLGGSGFWEFLAQEFYSTASPDDRIPQSAMNGMDAVMSIINPDTITIPSNILNLDVNNPRTLLSSDRRDDANAYIIFLGMALMGSLQSRYGSPTANNHKSVNLPWDLPANTQGDGCAFSAALLNMIDGIDSVLAVALVSNDNYEKILSFLKPAINAACAFGCATTCAGAVTCTSCPITLRNRDSCSGLTTDVNSCAAAGISLFVNSSWQGPP